MKEDLIKIIKTFDSFLDDMFDMGAFDPSNPTDFKIEKMVADMKKKYLWFDLIENICYNRSTRKEN